MRFFIFLCLIALHVDFGLTSESQDLARRIRATCQSRTGASNEDIRKGQTGIFEQSNVRLSCYMKCVLNEINVMDNNGMLTLERAILVLPPDVAFRFGPRIADCGRINDPNPCSKAMKIHRCVYRKYPQIYYLP